MRIWYGDDVADDTELRLVGDITGKGSWSWGLRLHPTPWSWPSPARRRLRWIPPLSGSRRFAADAVAAEVKVECHTGELADLGLATSGSIDLVVAAHSLDDVDDLPRLLRQVHRVLRVGAPFVVAMRHPVAAMFDGAEPTARRAYGSQGITFAELYMAFDRTNFHFDAMYELEARHRRDAVAPAVLVLRARKQGN